MRQFIAVSLILLAVVCSAAPAAFEVTADDMRDNEDLFKSLDSNLSLGDSKAASQARELQAYFQSVEGYYASQPDKSDAAGYARRAHRLAAEIAQAVEAGHVDAAMEAQAQLTRTCKSCHERYKSP